MGYNRNILDAEKIISKKELENLYLNKKFSDSKIGEIFNISLGRIHRLRNRYGIKTIEYYERHHKQELNQKEKELIVGVLLGDGHMRLRGGGGSKRSYPQLMLEQSVKHREYIYWLKNEIRDWLYDPTKTLKQVRKLHKKSKKAYHSYAFQTICHPVFNEFYDAFYVNKKKKINLDILNKYFTEYSFAIWIMDDGTKSAHERRLKICSHSFSQEENKILRDFLDDKYGLKAHVRKTFREGCLQYYYYLDFSVDSTKQISNMVSKFVIPEMQYKLVSSETTKGAGLRP